MVDEKNFIKVNGFDKRKRREDSWTGIIIHHTDIGGRKTVSDSLWKTLAKNISNFLAAKDEVYVSAHYLIGRNGEIFQIIDPKTDEAFHAGKSSYWHPYKRQVVEDWNRYAIGIELLGDGNMIEYSPNQYDSLISLTSFLKTQFATIHPHAILGHEQISYGRKTDPGKLFDWRRYFSGVYSEKI